MFALILVYLLFSVCGSKANTGSSAGKKTCQLPNFCMTLRDGDITAEAGLCVVIPCSFTTDPNFIASKIIWSQCQTPDSNCRDSDMIFYSSDPSIAVKPGFKGRVSLLEPDVSQKNCSIIINDLRESDSGFYQLRVEENQRTGRFAFRRKASLSVKGSSDGKKRCQLNNFCMTLRDGDITAEAGLCVVIPCSFTTDSDFRASKIIWYQCQTPDSRCPDSDRIFSSDQSIGVKPEFRGRVSLLEPDVSQGNCSIIINDLRESDSGFYQLRVESPLDRFTFGKKASLSVKGLTQKPTVEIPPLTEGQQTTLSCTAPGLCSGPAPEITWMWRGGGETENLRHSSSLTFTPSAELHGTDVTCKVSFQNSISTERTETLNVSYIKKPVIEGERKVKLVDALNLTCSVDSFPPSVVTWTKLGSNKTLKEETRRAELIIPIMTAEDGGKYICTATHQITNQTTHTEVKVTILPRILNSSACEVESEVLTCECISQGFPLPTVEWPLLKNHTPHCVTTSTTNDTVNTSIIVFVGGQNYTTVVCVSKNNGGEVKEDLKVIVKNVTQTELEEEAGVSYTFGSGSVLPWAAAAALSLIVNAVLLICVVFLWTKRKTVKPNQEDRTYMSLQKTDRSPVYDVICQPLN